MEYDLEIKRGLYKGFEYILRMDEVDSVELEYRGITNDGRLLYDIFKVGGIGNYINKYFKLEDFENVDNSIHTSELSYITSGNGFDKHCELGM